MVRENVLLSITNSFPETDLDTPANVIVQRVFMGDATHIVIQSHFMSNSEISLYSIKKVLLPAMANNYKQILVPNATL